MIWSEETANKVADLLLQINAIKLNVKEPFVWSSGWKSPIYCDNRLSLSFPEIRTYIKEQLCEIIRTKFATVELIAGVATAGIPHGTLVANQLELPLCYVRSSAKDHGLGNQIEGLALPGQKVVVVEDLISTGGSSLNAVDALRKAGCDVIGLVAIFSYGFPISEQAFKEAKCPFFTLTDYEALVNKALANHIIHADEVTALKEWRLAPSIWQGKK